MHSEIFTNPSDSKCIEKASLLFRCYFLGSVVPLAVCDLVLGLTSLLEDVRSTFVLAVNALRNCCFLWLEKLWRKVEGLRLLKIKDTGKNINEKQRKTFSDQNHQAGLDHVWAGHVVSHWCVCFANAAGLEKDESYYIEKGYKMLLLF